MYIVMSAEEVDGHLEPFLHAVCEDEETARETVAKFVKTFEFTDENGELIKPGHNDHDKWATLRYDEDGMAAWRSSYDGNAMTIIAKWIDISKKDICL